MELSIVVPVYNSDAILSELCDQIEDTLVGKDFELILVNDGSVDDSWNVIERISKGSNSIQGVCLAKNFGQDNAIMAGLSFTSGDYVVIMDDDLQHSPSDILVLLDKIKNGWDVCYADFSSNLHQAWWKNIGSKINSKQAEYLINKPNDIYLSPFKVIARVVVDAILEYKGPYPYVDGLIFRITNSITQVPIPHHERFEGKGNYNIKRSLSVFFKHTTGFSVVPLRVASLIGLLFAISGFILGIFYIYIYLVDGSIIEGWTSIVVLQLFIGGMILMSLGVIGEYIGRSYLAINRKPQFVVRKISS